MRAWYLTVSLTDGLIWKKLQVEAPDKSSVLVFANRDKNGKIIREEVLGKKLLKVVQDELAAQQPPNTSSVHYKRREAAVYINWIPGAKVEATGPDDWVLKWNNEVAGDNHLDKQKIAEVLRNTASERSSVEWSL